MKPKILVVHPSIGGVGGSDQVAAWTLQALCEDFHVSCASWDVIDPSVVDEFCSTELRRAKLAYYNASGFAQTALGLVPGRWALARIALLLRIVRKLDRAHRFDCIVSTFNEMDFGRRGIQYIHYPWSHLPRPDSEKGWHTRFPGLLSLYHALCRAAGRMSSVRMAENVSIANSAFVAEKVTEMTGRPCQIVFPPVPGHYPHAPSRDRRNEVVCVGRLSPEKRPLAVVDIVERLRSRGFDLGLRLVGIPDDPDYTSLVEKRAAACSDWVTLELAPSRERVLQAMQEARFGIHAMREEHFGIVVAEMILSGCIVFAHASGGPVEILDGEPDLLFRDDDDAVDKIAAVIESDRLSDRLYERLRGRRELFGVESFMREMKTVVGEAIAVDGENGNAVN